MRHITQQPFVWNYRWLCRKLRNGTKRRAKVCVVHAGRCGSTVLARMLRRHAEVDWAGEFLGYYRSKLPRRYTPKSRTKHYRLLEMRMYRGPEPIFGFEVKPVQIQGPLFDLEIEEFIKQLSEIGFTHLVLLERRNYLRRIASLLLWQGTGVLHSKASPEHPEKVHIAIEAAPLWGQEKHPIGDVFRKLAAFHERVRVFGHRQRTLKFCELQYEQDIQDDPKLGYRKVCRFFGIQRRGDVRADLARTNPFPIEQVVENAVELKSALAGTEHEWMLDS